MIALRTTLRRGSELVRHYYVDTLNPRNVEQHYCECVRLTPWAKPELVEVRIEEVEAVEAIEP